MQTSLIMKIKESYDGDSLSQPNHWPEKAAWEGSQKEEYTAIKCHKTPGDNDIGSYEINLPYVIGRC